MANIFEHFLAFGTDIFGLERILRGLQSLCQIFAAWPFLLTYLSSTLTVGQASLYSVIFNLLQSRIGLTRRIIRTFGFLKSFNAGYLLYQSRGSSDQGIEVWLDVVSKTTLGMWGMLETITILDVIDVPGLEGFGPERSKDFNRQAMVYWFVALVASSLSNLVKISKVSENGGQVRKEKVSEKKKSGKGRKAIDEKASGVAVVEGSAQATAKRRQLGIKVLSDTMDMIIPAAVVGWVDVDPGLVASVMFVTTFFTSMDAWSRIGKQVDARAA